MKYILFCIVLSIYACSSEPSCNAVGLKERLMAVDAFFSDKGIDCSLPMTPQEIKHYSKMTDVFLRDSYSDESIDCLLRKYGANNLEISGTAFLSCVSTFDRKNINLLETASERELWLLFRNLVQTLDCEYEKQKVLLNEYGRFNDHPHITLTLPARELFGTMSSVSFECPHEDWHEFDSELSDLIMKGQVIHRTISKDSTQAFVEFVIEGLNPKPALYLAQPIKIGDTIIVDLNLTHKIGW